MHSKPLPAGIYGITAEKFSLGRDNVTVAREMIAGGVAVLQYREKHDRKSFRDMYAECLAIRRLTRESGTPFIVNDYVELAMLVDADGVHLGQDDLPVSAVRRRVGDKIIGLSTHGPEQAAAAVQEAVDYIGAGPIFATRTKDDVCDPVGLEYLNHVMHHVPLPAVAIGGIKTHNLDRVLALGARTVCLVTEIVGAADIAGTVRRLKAKMERNSVLKIKCGSC
jgi:thiamine-phosphate pyrophosphorylase